MWMELKLRTGPKLVVAVCLFNCAVLLERYLIGCTKAPGGFIESSSERMNRFTHCSPKSKQCESV